MPKFGQTFLANKEQIKSANAFLHSSSFFTDHILLLEFSAGSSLALSSAYKVFQVGGFPGEKMRATYVTLLHTAGVDNQVCKNVGSLYLIKNLGNRLSFYHLSIIIEGNMKVYGLWIPLPVDSC